MAGPRYPEISYPLTSLGVDVPESQYIPALLTGCRVLDPSPRYPGIHISWHNPACWQPAQSLNPKSKISWHIQTPLTASPESQEPKSKISHDKQGFPDISLVCQQQAESKSKISWHPTAITSRVPESQIQYIPGYPDISQPCQQSAQSPSPRCPRILDILPLVQLPCITVQEIPTCIFHCLIRKMCDVIRENFCKK